MNDCQRAETQARILAPQLHSNVASEAIEMYPLRRWKPIAYLTLHQGHRHKYGHKTHPKRHGLRAGLGEKGRDAGQDVNFQGVLLQVAESPTSVYVRSCLRRRYACVIAPENTAIFQNEVSLTALIPPN